MNSLDLYLLTWVAIGWLLLQAVSFAIWLHLDPLPTSAKVRFHEDCVKEGHAWQTTTSDAFRRCTRTGCQAVIRHAGERWVYILPAKRSRQTSHYTQGVFWHE
jgi:hypothetical protein